MRLFNKVFLVMLICLLTGPMLAGCESYGAWNERGKTEQQTGSGGGDTTARLDNPPIPHFPVPEDRDLKIMTSKLSGGAVEIYDLDGEIPSGTGAGVAPVTPDYIGIPVATDPRVTVYPLDGVGGGGAGAGWASAPMPITQSPVSGGHGMTPPPVAWGGDANGVPSPEIGQSVSRVYFPYGSAALNSSNRAALGDVAEMAKFAPVDRVSIEGHASARAQTSDPVKAKILNLKESMNRAQAVSQNLIESGVPAEKIKTVAWGDTRPSGGEATQRRVDIVTGAGN